MAPVVIFKQDFKSIVISKSTLDLLRFLKDINELNEPIE